MSEINLGQVVGPRGFQGIQGVKGDKGDQGIQGEVGPKVDVAASLGTSTVYAVSQKLLTDEVDKMNTSIATIKSQSDESIVKVDNADNKIDTKTSELQTSITAILGINKKLTNRINALEESNIYEMFNSSNGIWLDPSDLKTMFQSSRGATPVTKDGDPVGLILDKSQGLESGGMDFKTIKGGFNSSEWVLKPENIDSSGRLVLSPTSGRVIYKTAKPMLKNKTYKIEVEIDESINVNFGIRVIYTNTNLGGTYTVSSYVKEKGLHTYYINFSSVDEGYIGVDRINGHTGEVYINSISVTEVKGNHASQSLAASRPTYRTDGVIHWLEFDGVDDSLDINITATKSYYMSLSFNYKDRSAGAAVQLRYNGGNFIYVSATNSNFNLFNTGTGSGRLEDTSRYRQGMKVITAYLGDNESSYIGQSGEVFNLPTGLSGTVSKLTIGSNTVFDVHGLILKDSSQFYTDRSKQLHSYMQRKAGVEI